MVPMNYADWKRSAKAYVKGMLRRQRDLVLPDREVRAYQNWIGRRQIERAARYERTPEPGLLSILTPVWNGSPLRYVKELADSISAQNQNGACEWVVLDNGCSERRLVAYLRELSKWPGIRLIRAETNLGITPG